MAPSATPAASSVAWPTASVAVTSRSDTAPRRRTTASSTAPLTPVAAALTISRTRIAPLRYPPMQASTVRTCAAAAAVPATLVVVGHLAYLWQLHPASADRQTAAFDHGLALAAILAAVLAAGRVAQWLEGRSGYVWGEVIGVVAT